MNLEKVHKATALTRRAAMGALLGLSYLTGWVVGDTVKHITAIRVVVGATLFLLAVSGLTTYKLVCKTCRQTEELLEIHNDLAEVYSLQQQRSMRDGTTSP